MSKREVNLRHSLIIKSLQKRALAFDEILTILERESEIQGYNFITSKRTFQRDLEDIRSMYDIDIQFDYSRKVYFVADEGNREANLRLLEAFDTFNALNVSERFAGHVIFENRKPQGTEHLYGILHAIKNKLRIEFQHEKYWEDEAQLRLIEPYALKEFKNRWYVIGKDLKDEMVKSFGLDRISELQITKTKFTIPADLDVEAQYRYCFGIIAPNGKKPQEIILSFDPYQGKYIKSLPLHHSQQIILDNEDEVRVKLSICLTHDFLMELLSMGEYVKVLKPAALIKEVKQAHEKAVKQYSNGKT